MCGRYYLDSEYEKYIQEKIKYNYKKASEDIKQGEIYPTDKVPVLIREDNHIIMDFFTWGFPNYKSNGVIINARSETVKEKRMFRDSILNRRCIILASGFYEWDISKNKIFFKMKDNPIMFMAGIYNNYEGENRFVILTANANNSIIDVHNRMPLVLESEDLESWIFNLGEVDNILNKTSPLLERNSEKYQLRLDI